MFVFVIQSDGVVDIINHCEKFEQIQELVEIYLKDYTPLKEGEAVVNSGMYYKKVSDQCYEIYEAVEIGYIFETYLLKESQKLSIVYYSVQEKRDSYAKVVKSK